MMIGAVDQNDARRRLSQCLRGREAAEAATNDHDAFFRQQRFHCIPLLVVSQIAHRASR